jgi:hypothetical protein
MFGIKLSNENVSQTNITNFSKDAIKHLKNYNKN